MFEISSGQPLPQALNLIRPTVRDQRPNYKDGRTQHRKSQRKSRIRSRDSKASDTNTQEENRVRPQLELRNG